MTSTADTNTEGANTTCGALRYVINQLDASGGSSNIIQFGLGSGVQTINVSSQLPAINKPVAIEVTVSNGMPQVFISGNSAGNASGLQFISGSSGSSIEDLGVVGFSSNYGIDLDGSDNDTITGCGVGVNSSGTADPNNIGIADNGSGATIGGASSGAGNLISANHTIGLESDVSVLIEGNLIGTNAAGTASLGGQLEGLDCYNVGVTIGGTAAGAGNVISGNSGAGVQLDDSCLIEGNRIGTDETGTIAIPNYGGIEVTTPRVTIGGTSAGAGNIIAYNESYGVTKVLGAVGVTIRYNAIYSNGAAGIELAYPNLVPNSPNSSTNTPIITSVGASTISGTLNAAPNTTYSIDLYSSPSGESTASAPQGRDYLGSTTIETDAAGNAIFSVPQSPMPGDSIFNATATRSAGTTSQFSPIVGFGLNAIGTIFSAQTGSTFQGTVASFTSYNPAAVATEFTATIKWGDGTTSTASTVVATPGGSIVTGSHEYLTANPDTSVTVTLSDSIGGSQATATSLANVMTPSYSLTATGTTISATTYLPFEGTVASFVSTYPTAALASLTAMINWGDGTANTTGTIVDTASGFVVVGSHTYTTANPQTAVSLTINQHQGGGIQSGSGGSGGGPSTTASTLANVGNLLTAAPQSVSFVAGTLYSCVHRCQSRNDCRSIHRNHQLGRQHIG